MFFRFLKPGIVLPDLMLMALILRCISNKVNFVNCNIYPCAANDFIFLIFMAHTEVESLLKSILVALLLLNLSNLVLTF